MRPLKVFLYTLNNFQLLKATVWTIAAIEPGLSPPKSLFELLKNWPGEHELFLYLVKILFQAMAFWPERRLIPPLVVCSDKRIS